MIVYNWCQELWVDLPGKRLANESEISRLRQEGEQVIQEAAAKPVVGWLTRLGYAVHGFLFILIGFLAIQVALGGRGRFVDHRGAIAAIAAEPFGEILLIVIAVGLIGSILWGILRALLDPYNEGKNLRGVFTRLGYLASSISYGTLLLPTFQYLLRVPVSSVEGTEQAAASILTTAWGPWVLSMAGLVVAAVGIAQFIFALQKKFGMQFDRYQLTERQEAFIRHIGRFGYAARGAVFVEIGILVIYAARTFDPEKVDGIDGALLLLAQQPYGTVLLGIIAAGLMSFGVYSLLGAAWFHIKQT